MSFLTIKSWAVWGVALFCHFGCCYSKNLISVTRGHTPTPQLVDSTNHTNSPYHVAYRSVMTLSCRSWLFPLPFDCRRCSIALRVTAVIGAVIFSWIGTCGKILTTAISWIISISLVACCARLAWIMLFCCQWCFWLTGKECLRLRGFAGLLVMGLLISISLNRSGSPSPSSRCSYCYLGYCCFKGISMLSMTFSKFITSPIEIDHWLDWLRVRAVCRIQSLWFCSSVPWTCCVLCLMTLA